MVLYFSLVPLWWLLCVLVKGGVLVPGAACAGEVFVGGGVAVAEGLGDDGGWGLEDEFAQGCGAGFGSGDAQAAQ